jgi:carboxyl-terminal processing protease
MSRRFLTAFAVMAGVSMVALMVRGSDASPRYESKGEVWAKTPEKLARLAWDTMDAIMRQDVEPPARQAMMLGAIKGLARGGKQQVPHDLSQRISGITAFEGFQALVKEYWPKAPDAALQRDAQKKMMDGLLAAISADTTLLSATALKVQNSVSASHYVGIGIQYQINAEEKVEQVMTPFRGGPAHRAGLKPGDLLVEVDGRSTAGIDDETVANWVRGPEGTPVTVTVRQPKSQDKRTYRIIRGVIPIETVHGYRRAPDGWRYQVEPGSGVGYIFVNALHASTLHELRQADEKLKNEGLRALVIDLRFSGAGNAPHQVELIGDSLGGGGTLWRTCDAEGKTRDCTSSRECLFRDLPLAVLVNEEVADPLTMALAAALHDNRHATIIGVAPKVEGYIKTAIDLPNGIGGAMVPTARLERADPKLGWPLQPDYPVTTSSKQRGAIEEWLAQKDFTELPAGSTDEAPSDPQLQKAVTLLKKSLEQMAHAK